MPARAAHEGLERALRWGAAAAFAALILLPTTRLFDPKGAAALALAAALLLGAALGLGSDGPAGWGAPSWASAGAWAAAAAAAGAALLASPYRALLGSPDPVPACAAAVCLALAAAPRAWGRALLGAWQWALAVVALYALAQRLGFEPYRPYAGRPFGPRAFAGYGNPDCLAAFLVLSWPLALGLKGWRRAAVLGAALAALAATQSRSGLAALALQALLLPASAFRPSGAPASGPGRRSWIPGLAALVGALALFPPADWLRPTQRLPLWRASLGLWLQRPLLGWGPGAFALAFQGHAAPALRSLVDAGDRFAESPHQLLLALACGAGLAGLAAFAVAAWVCRRQAASSPLEQAPLLALGLAGVLMESQTDRFFFAPGILVPVAAAWGLLAWRPPAPQPRGAGARPWAALACAALATACLWSAAQRWAGSGRGVGAALDARVDALADSGDPAALEALARTRPDDAALWERWGDALAARRDYPSAARVLAHAEGLSPTPGGAQNLGNCYLVLGRPADAERAYRLAVRLAPDSADAHFSLGYAYFYERRLKAAVAELDEALRLDPGHAGARHLKDEILR